MVQYLATNPPLSALLALTIIGFTVSYGAAFLVGLAGVEIGFVLNLAPVLRRSLATSLGAIVGLLVGAAFGAFAGNAYGLGPPQFLLGLMCFFGLTVGTYVGGVRRETVVGVDPVTDQLTRKPESVVMERVRWMVWHYTALDVTQALAVGIAILLGTAAGALIVMRYPVYRSGMKQLMWVGIAAGIGAILGGSGARIANPFGKLYTILTGMAVGLASAAALGVLLVSFGESQGYLIPGLVYGGMGGMCFGMLGGDPSRSRRPEE